MSEIKREEKKASELRFSEEELNSLLLHEEEQYSGCYERAGWRLYKIDKTYYITYFSHCSCYTTWDEITILECVSGKEDYTPSYKFRLAYLWKGDAKQILEFARNRLDPYIHDREISSRDSGFESLYKMYKWIESNVKTPVEPKPKPRPELEDTGIVSNEFIAAAAKWSAQAMAALGFVPAMPTGSLNPDIKTVRFIGSGYLHPQQEYQDNNMTKWYKIPGKTLRGIVLALYAQPLIARVFSLLKSWAGSFFFFRFFTGKKK